MQQIQWPPPVLDSPVFQLIRQLRMPPADYAICGSTPLLIYCLKKGPISDIDIVAKHEAWRRVCAIQPPVRAESGHGLKVSINRPSVPRIDIYNEWIPGSFTSEEIISGAYYIQGYWHCLRVADPRHILDYKLLLNREKDQHDIELLIRYMRAVRLEFK